MPTIRELSHAGVPTDADSPSSPRVAALRGGAWSTQRVAKIAGAVYLIQYATSFYGIFVRSSLVVSGDAARTARNILEHGQMFRGGIVCDLFTGACVVILNLALYELLAPVHRSLARLAATWRIVEVSVSGAIAVCSFSVLTLLGSADYQKAFEPQQIDALVRLFAGAHSSGYMIALLFFGLGSTTYMSLLVRSRYVPTALAVLGAAGSALVVVFALVSLLFPATVAAIPAVVRTLPAIAQALLGLIVAPVVAFEFLLGIWLLVKGVREA